MKLVLLLALVACGDDSSQPQVPVDAPKHTTCTPTSVYVDSARCTNAMARTTRIAQAGQPGCPSPTIFEHSVTCGGGCAIEVNKTVLDSPNHELEALGPDPSALCAESAVAKIGEVCTAKEPCLPTRVSLNPDGTVASQQYLACVSGSCAAVAPPAGTVPLAPCTALLISTHGGVNVNGFVRENETVFNDRVALLAWDDAMQMTACGMSHSCVGDWQCGVGMLCDDMITPLETTPRVAVCKPGPRGILTPSMLSPGL